VPVSIAEGNIGRPFYGIFGEEAEHRPLGVVLGTIRAVDVETGVS
jgi:hypothetical protein